MRPLSRARPAGPVVSDLVQFNHDGDWVAAIVTKVHPNGTVDLTLFPPGQSLLVFARTPKGEGLYHWRWPAEGILGN